MGSLDVTGLVPTLEMVLSPFSEFTANNCKDQHTAERKQRTVRSNIRLGTEGSLALSDIFWEGFHVAYFHLLSLILLTDSRCSRNTPDSRQASQVHKELPLIWERSHTFDIGFSTPMVFKNSDFFLYVFYIDR